MLEHLAEHPFITIVATEDEVHIYVKDIRPEHIAQVRRFLDELEAEL